MADINMMFIGIVSFLMLFLFGGAIALIIFMAGSEGRFHIGRFIRRGGLDLLSYQRLSQELSMEKIKWDGKFWTNKENAVMTGIDPVMGTDPVDEQYNKAIASTARWKGNKRSVLWATEEMFFVFSHGFLDLVTKASRFQRYLKKKPDVEKDAAIEQINQDYKDFIEELEEVKNVVKESTDYPKSKAFIDMLLTQVQMGYKGLKIYTIVTADEINKYLEGATPRVLMEARDQGKAEGGLEMTKPEEKKGMPPMVKALAISASLIMALVIAYVAITGKNPVEGIKSVIPG